MSDHYSPKEVESRISEATLIKVQAISGLVVASYLTMHFISIVSGNSGPATFNHSLNIFRELYQSPFYEIPMLLSIPIHMVAGKMRMDKRHEREKEHNGPTKSQNEAITFPEKQMKWHRRAAKFISLAIIGHFAGTKVLSMLSGILPSFSTMQFTLTYPYGVFFLPYYCALGLSGAYHFINGLYYATRNLGYRKILPAHTDKIVYYTGIAVGGMAVGAIASFAGFTGHKDVSAFAALNNYFFPGARKIAHFAQAMVA